MDAKGETEGQSKYLDIVSTAQANIELKEKELVSVNNSLEKYEKDLQDILKKKKLANENFYKKFSRFIQEGTWTGENYIDANVYFFDAQKVIARGAQPKVNYSLDVIDVSSLVDDETGWSYSPYAFKVGDISSIIDTQYFGYVDKAKTKPKREKVVVSEVTYMLDNPEKNSLQIQNYSTQFQDLFQRLNASVQSLELNKNTYAKSENFTGKGALTLESLQESFDKNKQLAFSNVDSKIIYDNTGITLSTNGIDDKTGETIENKYQVKLVGGGIILSSDGGQTWKTGIYGGEINTALLRAGQIDAELINIMMGTVPTFKWDKDGLIAYGQTTDKEGKTVVVKTGQRVVFDGEGIRGYYEKGENDAYNIPNFSLTHNGLTIDNPYDDTMEKVPVISVNGKANPDSEEHSHKFIVYNDGSLEAYNGTFNGTVRAAKFEGMSQGKLIGPELMVGLKSGASSKSENGEDYNFWVDSNGNVKITGGSISFSSLDQTTKDNISSANTAATEAKAAAAGAQVTADAANGLASSANSAAISAVNKVNGWAYSGTTYIDGTKIMTGTVMASKLLGGSVGLIAPTTTGEMTVGSMDIVYTNDNTQYGLGITSSSGGIQIVSARNTNIFLSAGSGSAITMSGGKVKLSGALCLGATYGTASPKSLGISGDYGQIYVQYV